MSRILAFFLGLILVSLYVGYDLGQDSQKAKDQIKFDQVNQERSDQKAQANKLLADLQQQIITEQAQAAKFKNQLEKQRAENNQAVNDLRTQYASAGLRFTIKGSGCGDSSSGSSGSQGCSSRADAPTSIQLPETITASLRQLAFDADRLAVEYATCYAYVNR